MVNSGKASFYHSTLLFSRMSSFDCVLLLCLVLCSVSDANCVPKDGEFMHRGIVIFQMSWCTLDVEKML